MNNPLPPPSPGDDPNNTEGVRLNKWIADSGFCARRKADELIAAGRVRVNGQAVSAMGLKINPEADTVSVDGSPLKPADKRSVLFHKPVGVVTSRKAGKGQKSLYQVLPKHLHALDPAGRLDQDSSGLLILSSDGDFLNRITHPRYHLGKVYEITLNRALKPDEITQLKAGIRLQPENKLAQMVDLKPITRHPPTYHVTLITGYNRQIRRSVENFPNARVETLRRIAFGPVELGDLPPGGFRALSEKEIKALCSGTPPEKRQDGAQNKNGNAKKHAQQDRNPQAGRQHQQKTPKTRDPKA